MPGLCPILGTVREIPGRMVTLSSCTPHLVGFRAGWHRSSKRRYIICNRSSGNLYIRDRRNKALNCFLLNLSMGMLPVTSACYKCLTLRRACVC